MGLNQSSYIRKSYIVGSLIGENGCSFVKDVDTGEGARKALFKCHCGNEFIGNITSVRSGKKRGCESCRLKMKPHNYSHGMTDTTEYRTWCHMIARCYNPTDAKYPLYGARGIFVHDEWRNNFMAFYNYVGSKPNPKWSLDRIDVNSSYIPGNVRWASPKTQSNNTRSNIYLTFKGKTLTATEWGDLLGIMPCTIRARKKRGWTDEDSLTKPIRPINHSL